MNYLEKEIDEAIIALNIEVKKLAPNEVDSLITSLSERFFRTKQKVLDPSDLNIKNEQHNPNFWKEIPDIIHSGSLILIVFDSSQRAWRVGSANNLTSILSETTGYPFWVTDQDQTFVANMDDHDCVTWA
ncbi:hypothetical protein [Pseudomonas yamanorum]|uniref:Uncharacterized protein n=1 Tax=Pseudomonas yamanorum TaxID=515393 RepID=A0A7Y8FH38_9PSED|nr:hypothetical protein [Pseudomonas yamanorum]NWE78833.1 hypothetical protein [Pseudomonas yamanorum]